MGFSIGAVRGYEVDIQSQLSIQVSPNVMDPVIGLWYCAIPYSLRGAPCTSLMWP